MIIELIDNFTDKFAKQIKNPFSLELENDIPAVTQISAATEVVYVITKQGYLYLFDFATGSRFYAAQVAQGPVFSSAFDAETYGITAIERSGRVFTVSLDRAYAPALLALEHPNIAQDLARKFENAQYIELHERSEKILDYARQFDRSYNFMEALKVLLDASPDIACETAIALVHLEGGPYVSVESVADLFSSRNLLKETTMFLFETLANTPETSQMQTNIIEWNIKQAPEVAETILSIEKFNFYDKNRIIGVCEEMGLHDRAAYIREKESMLRLSQKIERFGEYNLWQAELEWENAKLYKFKKATNSWDTKHVQVKINPPFSYLADSLNGNLCVRKDSPRRFVIRAPKEKENIKQHFEEAKTQRLAKLYARKFNLRDPPQKVRFTRIYVLEMEVKNEAYRMEEFLEGEYGNYFDTNTYPAAHAFSHFTYEESNRQHIVTDFQGIGYTFTNPKMLQPEVRSLDMQNPFATSLNNHSCNHMCNLLNLAPIEKS